MDYIAGPLCSIGYGDCDTAQTDRAYEQIKSFIARQLRAKRLAA